MRRKVLALTLGLLLTLSLASPAAATHSYEKHWAHKSKNFIVRIGDNVDASIQDGKYQRAFEAAVYWWNNHPNVDLVIEPGQSAKCGFVKGTVQVCARYYDTWWSGKADTAYDSTGHTYAGYARINRKYHDSYSESSNQKVFCHEIGHTLGLGHRDVRESCMKQGGSGKYPDQHDFDMITTKHHVSKQDSSASYFTQSDSSPTVGPPAPTSSSSSSGGDDGDKTCLLVLCYG